MQDKREKQLRIVDVPGHPRISKGIFASHTDRAKGVVFVVDSVEFMMQKDQVGAAAYLAGRCSSGGCCSPQYCSAGTCVAAACLKCII